MNGNSGTEDDKIFALLSEQILQSGGLANQDSYEANDIYVAFCDETGLVENKEPEMRIAEAQESGMAGNGYGTLRTLFSKYETIFHSRLSGTAPSNEIFAHEDLLRLFEENSASKRQNIFGCIKNVLEQVWCSIMQSRVPSPKLSSLSGSATTFGPNGLTIKVLNDQRLKTSQCEKIPKRSLASA